MKRRPKFLKGIVNRWDNDSDILFGKGRLEGQGLRFVGPMAHGVYQETDVTVKPEQ